MNRDRNLLFGILAVQLRKLTPGQLVDVAAMWATDPSRPLAQRLVEQKILSEKDRQFIDDVVSRAIADHGGNAGATLASFGGEAQVEQTFCGSIVCASGEGVSTREGSPAFDGGIDLPAGLDAPGRYTHMGEFGRGGMGRVLLVHDTHLGRDIAMKELLPNLGGGSGSTPVRRTVPFLARFLQEARITGKLEHPSIVPVYELGRNREGHLYYTMKLVRGRTLYAAIHEASDTLGRLALLPHFVDLCHAIAYAHSRGVVHRDIKPANIMVGEFGETVVLDWGLAKALGREDKHEAALRETILAMSDPGESKDDEIKTQYGQALGTPVYMPPEQAQGHLDQIDERSDVYGLGAVLYELLTGKTPFSGMSSMQVLRAVIEEEPAPITKAADGVPPELAAICERAMRKDPAKRYPSAKELAADVQRFQSGALVQAHTYSPAQIMRRYARQHRAAILGSAAALAVILALTVFGFLRITQERNAALAAKQDADAQRGAAEEQKAKAEEEKAKAEEASYRSQLMVAGNYADKGQLGLTAQILKETPERLRQWEWGHLQWLASNEDLGDEIRKYQGDPIGINRDFTRYIERDKDSAAYICDVVKGKRLAKLQLPNVNANAQIYFSERAKYVFAKDGDSFHVLKAEDGSLLHTMDFTNVYRPSISPDETQIAIEKGRVIKIIELATGAVRFSIPRMKIPDPYIQISDTRAILADNNVLLCPAGSPESGRSELVALDVTDGMKRLASVPIHPYSSLDVIGFARDGKRLAVYEREGAHIYEVPTLTGKVSLEDSTGIYPEAPTFSNDGKYLVAGTFSGEFKIWEGTTGKLVHTLKAATIKDGNYLAFVLDGDYAALQRRSAIDSKIEVWNWRSGILAFQCQTVRPVKSTVKGGSLLYSAVDPSEVTVVRRVDAERRAGRFCELRRLVQWQMFDEESRRVGVINGAGSGTWEVYDFPEGTLRNAVCIPGMSFQNAVPLRGFETMLMFTNRSALLWEKSTPGRLHHVEQLGPGFAHAVSKSPAGNLIALSNDSAAVYEIGNWKQLYKVDADWSTRFAWSDDSSKIVIAGRNKKTQVRGARTGEIVCVFDQRMESPVLAPSGKALLGTESSKTLRLHSLPDGEARWTYVAGTEIVGAAIPPDESRVVFFTDDEHANVLDFKTGKLISSIPCRQAGRSNWQCDPPRFLRDGKSLLFLTRVDPPAILESVPWTAGAAQAGPATPKESAKSLSDRQCLLVLNPTQRQFLLETLETFDFDRNASPDISVYSYNKKITDKNLLRQRWVAMGLGLAEGDRITSINDDKFSGQAEFAALLPRLREEGVKSITSERNGITRKWDVVPLEMETSSMEATLSLALWKLLAQDSLVDMLRKYAQPAENYFGNLAETDWMLPRGYAMNGIYNSIGIEGIDPSLYFVKSAVENLFKTLGIQLHDWLRSINGQPVKDIEMICETMKQIMAQLRKGEPFDATFQIQRNVYQLVNITLHVK